MLDSKMTAYQRTLKDYWESIDKTPVGEDSDSE
jgi:hypothetical protein